MRGACSSKFDRTAARRLIATPVSLLCTTLRETQAREIDGELILTVLALSKPAEAGVLWERTQYGPRGAASLAALLVSGYVWTEIPREVHHIFQIEDVDKWPHLPFSKLSSLDPIGRSSYCHSAFQNNDVFSSVISSSELPRFGKWGVYLYSSR